MTVSSASSSEMQGITAWRIIKPISGTPLQGGILLMCSCNFLFGMQVVSTKELQRNLTIRGLNGRSSKGKGKGISYAQKGDWGPVHTIFLDAGSVRGRGRTRVLTTSSLSFFLVPRGKRARHENGLTKSEEKERLLAVYTRRTREAWPKGPRGWWKGGKQKGRDCPLTLLALLPDWSRFFSIGEQETTGDRSARKTARVTCLAWSPSLPDQRFSI